jgi:hypothetical protein
MLRTHARIHHLLPHLRHVNAFVGAARFNDRAMATCTQKRFQSHRNHLTPNLPSWPIRPLLAVYEPIRDRPCHAPARNHRVSAHKIRTLPAPTHLHCHECNRRQALRHQRRAQCGILLVLQVECQRTVRGECWGESPVQTYDVPQLSFVFFVNHTIVFEEQCLLLPRLSETDQQCDSPRLQLRSQQAQLRTRSARSRHRPTSTWAESRRDSYFSHSLTPLRVLLPTLTHTRTHKLHRRDVRACVLTTHLRQALRSPSHAHRPTQQSH